MLHCSHSKQHTITGLKMKLIQFLLLIILQTEFINCTIQQIQQCGVHCSEGLNCKAKSYLSLSPCKKQQDHNISTTINNVSLSTVMKCYEEKCSLNLKIVTLITLYGKLWTYCDHELDKQLQTMKEYDIHGVVMCLNSAGMLGRCQIVTYPHKTTEHGKQVEVEYDCFSVRPGQDVFVTIKTAPNFCNNIFTQKYTIPECAHENIRKKVTECKTGELMYTVDDSRREITVRVLEAPEDKDYHLRLCLKDQICSGTGPHKLIKKQDLHRNESLVYSRALPCLCIEGWPATTNARRIQVCPFKNNVEELWSGVTYDHYTQALSWKPLCPVQAVVSLCHAVGPKICLDIGNVLLSSDRNTVIFSTVDPHPQLCMKFTTEAGFWIECPFTSEHFPLWDVNVVTKADQQWIEITSWFPASFSVGLCKMSNSTACELTEERPFLISVEKTKPAAVNLSKTTCSICIQVKRIDVQFAVEENRCNLQCSVWRVDQWSYSGGLHKYALPLAVCVLALVMAVLIGKVTLKASGWGHGKRKLDKTPSCRTTAETETLIHTVSEDMDTGLRLA